MTSEIAMPTADQEHHQLTASAADPKAAMVALYSGVAPVYAEQGPPRFAYVGRRLVELAGVSQGDAVLDVATGRGAVLIPAADRIGHAGRAVGIDLAPGMVERTRAAILARDLDWASVELMDAQQLQFADESFSHVLCSFAVFFFADLPRVLAEMRRVLRPGAVVGFAFERGVDPRWAWYEDLLRADGALDDLPRMPGNGAIRQERALEMCLAEAGFSDPRERVEEVVLGYPNFETWWASLWTHGTRTPLERLSPERIAALQAACQERARELTGPNGLPEHHQFVFVTARR